MNPAEWLRRTATRTPDAPALLTGARLDADYAAFNRRAAAIGAALEARGIGRGDRVALFMANRTGYIEALYGTWYAGAAAVPVNAKLHPREAAWIVGDAEAALVFSDAAHATALGEAMAAGGPDILSLDGSEWPAFADGAAPMAAPVSLDEGDLAWLFYTSGTTGKPKGVMITCGNVAAMTFAYFIDVDEVWPEDAALYAAPVSHGAGLYNFMHVLRGARHVVPESGGFDPVEILDLAPRIGPVSMFAAPTMVRRLVEAARQAGVSGDGIRTIVYGGGPMYEADIIEAVRTMGPRFVQIYGQGESPMTITALSRKDVCDRRHPRWRERLGSVGVAHSVVEVRVLDETGNEVPRGETGEIAVRGASVMAGYWRRPEETAKTIRDGWLWTGDLGRMDADGYVTMIDRSKDLIISGGANIYPREVEEVLLAHEGVAEVAVVGHPHAKWGEEVVAFVVLRDGVDVAEGDLDRLCLDRIARFKRPKRYRFIEALPKNNYGKVLKTDLRAMLAGGG
ncbi:MAG: AMP-binding protein [Rhodospirillales bacterium]